MGPKTRQGGVLWGSGEGLPYRGRRTQGIPAEVTEVKDDVVNSVA